MRRIMFAFALALLASLALAVSASAEGDITLVTAVESPDYAAPGRLSWPLQNPLEPENTIRSQFSIVTRAGATVGYQIGIVNTGDEPIVNPEITVIWSTGSMRFSYWRQGWNQPWSMNTVGQQAFKLRYNGILEPGDSADVRVGFVTKPNTNFASLFASLWYGVGPRVRVNDIGLLPVR